MQRTGLTLLWALCLLVSVPGCGKDGRDAAQTGSAKKISGIEVSKTGLEEVEVAYRSPGTVRSGIQSVLTSKIMGNVREIHVKERDRVEKGETLMEIESGDITARIDQAQGALESAQAALRNAEANFKRISDLFSKGSATRFEFDGATMQLENARGMVKQALGGVREAQAFKNFALIAAPADGVVSRRLIDVGEQAAPGRPLLQFEDRSRLQFETFVPESIIHSLKMGQAVSVKVDALEGRVLQGRISEMEGSSDPVSHSSKIKIEIDGAEQAVSGMYGTALIPTRKRRAILIPGKAVVARGQLTVVYVMDAERILRLRLIKAGRTYGDRIEVLSGLRGDETIAVSGLDRIDEGMEITE